MNIRFLILLIAVIGYSTTATGQAIVKGSGVLYTNGAPTHSVNTGVDAEISIDTAAGLWYEYNRDAAAWEKAGWRVQRLPISIAPTAAPTDKQSEIVVNDVDSLYQWRGGAWRHLNKGADPSITNEGQLGVGAGGASSSVITSNTSGAVGVTINAAGILAISESTSSNGGSITLTATEVDGSTSNELQTYSHAGTTTYTNTLSNGGGSWSITGAGIAVISQTAGAVTVTATEVDGSLTNEGQLGVGAGGATSSVLTSNTSGATGVTINVGGINTISETTSANGGQITITATEVDGSTSNELQTYSHAGTTNYTNTLSNGGGSFTINAGGINTISHTGGTLTITATEVDGSTSNELQTYSHAGTTTYTNTLSNGGGSWSITGAGIAVISQTAGAVTVTATEVDGSVTNELQTVNNSSNATSHTMTLSNTGGSIQLVEGSNITITTTGTASDAIVTIASSGGGGSTNYQTWYDDGVAATQRANANFVSNTDIAFTLTDDAPNTETEVTADIPAAAVDFSEIQNVSTGTLAGRSTAGSGSLEQITVSTGLTISGGNLTAVDASASNELQTYSHAGTTTYTNTLSNGGGSWSITGAGIAVISQTAGAVTVTATEVDGSLSNEGSLSVGAGGGNDSQISSNTSGSTAITISGGNGMLVTESGSTITISPPTGTDAQTLRYNGSGVLVANSQILNNGTEVGIGGTPIAGVELYVAGRGRFDATIESQGTGIPTGGTGAAAVRLINTTPTTGQTWYLGSMNDGTFVLQSGNSSTVLTGETDGTIATTYDFKIGDVTGITPTTVIGRDANGLVGTVAIGSGLSLSGGTLSATGGGTNYQTWRDDGVAATQQANANFVSNSDIAFTLTNDGVNSETEVTADIPAAAVDFSEIQNVSTGTLAGRSTAGSGSLEQITVSTGLTISGGNLTAVDQTISNEGQLGVGAGGASSSVITSNTSGATGVTINVAGINTISESTSANGGSITITATEVDGSTSNELQTYSHAGTTTYTNTLSNGGGSWSITGAGIAVISQTAGAVTVTATEVDGSLSNEGTLGVGAGGASSSTIISNTSGATGVTINVAGINTISETTSANGGQITITATEVDGSTTNELQTVTNSSAATTHTLTLSNSGGSIQLVEGSNITLTTTGTAADGIVTIAATGGTGDINQNGNSFAAAYVIGTNDNNTVSLEQNGVTAFTLGTDKNVTLTNSVAATNTITNRLILQTNSTGTAANNFGTGILFQGESSTTNDRDLARIGAYWTTATDATRASAIRFDLGQNGGALAETMRLDRSGDAEGMLTIGTATPVQIYNDGIATGTAFTVGQSANALRLGGSSGTVELIRETSSTGIPNEFLFESRSTGTPTNGFGLNLALKGESSTTAGRDLAVIQALWTDVTDATRTSDLVFGAVNSTNVTEGLRIKGSGRVETASVLRIGATTGTPNQLLGRDGNFDVGVVTIGSGLSFSGGILSATGGGGTPAGASFQVQYNNAGAFGAEANFNYDPTNDQLVVGTGTAAAVIHGRGRNDSGVNVFLAENFSANDIFAVKSNGVIKLGDNETYPFLKQTNTAGGAVSYTANGITFESQPTATTTDVFSFNHPSYGLSSGTHNITRHTGTMSVASGTSIYRSVLIDPTINVNTTASGLADMLNISPTITQATGGVNMVNIVPSITAASGGLRGIRTDIAAATGFYQIYADGTAQSRFDGVVGIKTDAASGFDLHVVGNQRNDARMTIRGTGIPTGSNAAAAVMLTNTTGGADSWYLGSMNDGTFVLQSGNASTVLTGQTDGKVSTTYAFQIGDVTGFTPTTVIGRDADGDVGTVTLGSGVALSGGELPLWNSNDAGTITSLTSTALANITGLTFDVTTGKNYEFWAAIKYSAAATTTGSAFSIDCPTGTVQLHVQSATANNAQFFHAQNAENTLLASASSAYTSGNLAYVRGIFEATATGTCQLRGATEVNSSAITVQGASNVNWREIK